MASRSNLVNLDALIKREDFATADAEADSFENVSTISLRDFTPGGLMGPGLRKPDFQRETNHWAPEQVVSLLECFVNGDLIPSVILWKSPTYLFVIDGGHRLSALRAWVEDDYGDGPISQAFFGFIISAEQRKIASRTRELVAEKIGSWQHYQAKNADANLDAAERKKLITAVSRGLPIQWVKGDADKAESSFFKINTKGTPLDEIEELLLKNRTRPIAIAARAIIRSGKGHRYWSRFTPEVTQTIENSAKQLHALLFDPEINRPIKTLDLPLGGPKGVRTALQVLIDLILLAVRDQSGNPKTISDMAEDSDGSSTMKVLAKTFNLMSRVTGNGSGSLGLHPAVYFYGPTGRHSGPMFMGTISLIARKISNNDQSFFLKFTKVRPQLERLLVESKDLIATILQRHLSSRRIEKYAGLLDKIIEALMAENMVTEADIVKFAELDGKIVVGGDVAVGRVFSDDVKSQAFIKSSLAAAIKCPLCSGYLDPDKSLSYDHIIRAREGGKGQLSNIQLTHPYCNQSLKN